MNTLRTLYSPYRAILALMAALCLIGGLTTAPEAQAATITTLPRQSIAGQCPAGVPLTIWADFQKRSDNGQRRGVRGGFVKSDARYLATRVDVFSLPGSSHGWANLPRVTAGSAYATGNWATRSSVSVYVVVTLSGFSEPCGARIAAP